MTQIYEIKVLLHTQMAGPATRRRSFCAKLISFCQSVKRQRPEMPSDRCPGDSVKRRSDRGMARYLQHLNAFESACYPTNNDSQKTYLCIRGACFCHSDCQLHTQCRSGQPESRRSPGFAGHTVHAAVHISELRKVPRNPFQCRQRCCISGSISQQAGILIYRHEAGR